MTDQTPTESAPEKKSTAPLVLGIVATVLGSVALLGSFIPCLGAFAIYLAVPSLIVGLIGVILSTKAGKQNFALCVVGTSLSGIAILMALLQIAAMNEAIEGLDEAGVEIEKAMDEAFDEMQNEINSYSQE